MSEPAIVSALGQMGVAGILGLVVLKLFNLFVTLQGEYRQYLANQNALLQEQNKFLLLLIAKKMPDLADDIPQVNPASQPISGFGVQTKIE